MLCTWVCGLRTNLREVDIISGLKQRNLGYFYGRMMCNGDILGNTANTDVSGNGGGTPSGKSTCGHLKMFSANRFRVPYFQVTHIWE